MLREVTTLDTGAKIMYDLITTVSKAWLDNKHGACQFKRTKVCIYVGNL